MSAYISTERNECISNNANNLQSIRGITLCTFLSSLTKMYDDRRCLVIVVAS